MKDHGDRPLAHWLSPHPDIMPGDVALYVVDKNAPWSAKAVGVGEKIGLHYFGKQYSHVTVLAEEEGWQYEETFPWAQRSRLDESRRFEIWRIGRLTLPERAMILRWWHKKIRWLKIGPWWIGHPYNLVGVCTGGIIRLPGTYFCSQAAGMSYQAAGRGFGDDIMSPDGIPLVPGAKMIYRHIPRKP